MTPEAFWQELLPPGAAAPPGSFPARFDDGRVLALPIRHLPDGGQALASLIINQASFAVTEALAGDLAAKLSAYAPALVVGLPTLGLTLAAAVAARLGHARYLPLGSSAKFWYSAQMRVPITSITTPQQAKHLFIDPRMIPLLAGKRVALVDDVISSGSSMRAGLDLLALCGCRPVVLGTAMLQSDRWREALADFNVATVLRSPILQLSQTAQ